MTLVSRRTKIVAKNAVRQALRATVTPRSARKRRESALMEYASRPELSRMGSYGQLPLAIRLKPSPLGRVPCPLKRQGQKGRVLNQA